MPSFDTSETPEPHRGRRDPPVGVVLALRQRVSDGTACGAKLRVHEDEIRPGVDDLGALDRRFELRQPCLAPAAVKRAVAKLGDGLEPR